MRTLSAVPTTQSCVQIYLWIRVTSLYRTASWVPMMLISAVFRNFFTVEVGGKVDDVSRNQEGQDWAQNILSGLGTHTKCIADHCEWLIMNWIDDPNTIAHSLPLSNQEEPITTSGRCQPISIKCWSKGEHIFQALLCICSIYKRPLPDDTDTTKNDLCI